MTPGRHAAFLRDLWCWLPHENDCSHSGDPSYACDCGWHDWLRRLDQAHFELTGMYIINCIPDKERHKDRAMSYLTGEMGMKGKG